MKDLVDALKQNFLHEWIIIAADKTPILVLIPFPGEKIKMPRPLLIFSQSDDLIRIVAINSYT